ncbi:hypothetical protein F5887DRAFT_976524 [Amanita rubescens]|nr:hypothetical protein F5887DRAFT_976524 [Amanita rubescens]
MGRKSLVRGNASALILFPRISGARGCPSHAQVSCSPVLILALVVGIVFIIVLVASAMICFRSRNHRRPYSAETESAMAEAARQERQMYLVNQARLDVEHWMQELERDTRRREEEEEEELVPPPYSRQPKLPTWCEHPDLQAQGEEEERGADEQPAAETRRSTNGSLSISAAERKETGSTGATIQYPPPSYSPC